MELLGPSPRRKLPHIYSDEEIAALLAQCRLLLPRGRLRPYTYVTFFLIEGASDRGERLFIAHIVLCELAWVLAAAYRRSRDERLLQEDGFLRP